MQGWTRSTKNNPCIICGGGIGWCCVSPDETVAACGHIENGCMRYKDGRPVSFKNGNGWLHSLRKTPVNGHKYNGNGKHHKDEHLTVTEIRSILKEHSDAMTDDLWKQATQSLGLSIETLRDLEIGYDFKYDSFSFPMRNGKKQPIGIRTRRRLPRDGSYNKGSIKGSRNGIFIPLKNYETLPAAFMCDAPAQLLLIPEGPTSLGACVDLGFRAIGRPSNVGGSDYIRELLMQDNANDRQRIVIVIDADKPKWTPAGVPFVPGWEGGLHVADAICEYCNTLQFIRCPSESKDMRVWLQGGGTSAAIDKLIAEAETMSRAKIKEKMDSIVGWKFKGTIDCLLNHPERAMAFKANPQSIRQALEQAKASYSQWRIEHPDLRH